MAIADMFRVNQIKAQLEQTTKERDMLRSTLADTEHMQIHDLKRTIAELSEKKEQLFREVNELAEHFVKRKKIFDDQLQEFNAQIEAKRRTMVVMDDEILLQSFGFYKPKYDLVNSEEYKNKLDQIRKQQADLIKQGKAAYGTTNWSVNNSQKEGEKMVKDYVKLILRSFNTECDSSILSVKFNNIDSIEKRIRKAFEALNDLGRRMSIVISNDYLKLKLQELYLCYEYQLKKQQEKEEQKRIREQMREEAKLLKEIEDLKSKLVKEENHFNKALASIEAQLQRVSSEAERELLEKEKTSIQQRLAEVEKNKQDVQNREQNTRAGYVYIISNIGSFGEHIYKIGVTRRLDPQERVDELGDASVPFDFDIHAIIFSDDAPSLENALHKAFEGRRLNMINRRREFFRVTLAEIEQVVKHNFSKPVEFLALPDASEYRQSRVLRGEQSA
ncbi:MAG TPA: DUF4041 domain-containing protein [Roseiflexaceae bacterium]|nr:DUF4041 domain-containing protein [Roseiflexaceae bacterium]